MTVLKDIAYFSENGVKNYYSMLQQMKNSLWLTSKFRTNKNDIKNITVKDNYVYLHNKSKEKIRFTSLSNKMKILFVSISV